MTDPRRGTEVWSDGELYDKIDYEGGLAEALDWGVAQVRLESLVTDRLLFAAKEAYKNFEAARYVLEKHLEATVNDRPSPYCGKVGGHKYAPRACTLPAGHEGECRYVY